MKFSKSFFQQIAVYIILALPFYLMGSGGLLKDAVLGYVLAVEIYLIFQVLTNFSHVSNGLLITGLFAFLYALLIPALAKAHS